jgi:hypothetical protein
MDYPTGQLPQAASENKRALEAAMAYASHLESMGAKVQWVRGMQMFYLPEAAYIARADVCVAGHDGILHQFGADQLFHDTEHQAFLDFPPADSVGRLYRIAMWTSAVKAALEPALAAAFPRYQVHLDSELSVGFAYRDGKLIDHKRVPRRMRGFIAGFLVAWEVTAPHPDTAQTNPEESAQNSPSTAPPEPQP